MIGMGASRSFSGGLLYHRVLEQGRPEVGDGGGVVDLKDVELLSDLAVEFELLFLENGDDLLAQIDGDKIFELGHLDNLALCRFDRVGKVSGVSLVLEKSSHGSLSSIEVVEILLGGDLLLDKTLFSFGDVVARCNGGLNSLEIKYLTLGPMEHIDEGVLHLVTGVDELVFDCAVGGVVEDELGCAHVYVGCEVYFLVDIPHTC